MSFHDLLGKFYVPICMQLEIKLFVFKDTVKLQGFSLWKMLVFEVFTP